MRKGHGTQAYQQIGAASAPNDAMIKENRIVRMWDAKHRTLIHLAISRRLILGAPVSSISTVPVMAWQ
jgi:CreA protein